MIYDDYNRNHVILPGREQALERFLKQDYKGMLHKWKNRCNPHSEDALTWSCFDLLSHLPTSNEIAALDEIFEDPYEGKSKLSFAHSGFQEDQIHIHIGKQYTGSSSNESTEVDASFACSRARPLG